MKKNNGNSIEVGVEIRLENNNKIKLIQIKPSEETRQEQLELSIDLLCILRNNI